MCFCVCVSVCVFLCVHSNPLLSCFPSSQWTMRAGRERQKRKPTTFSSSEHLCPICTTLSPCAWRKTHLTGLYIWGENPSHKFVRLGEKPISRVCMSGGTHLTGLYTWGEPISQVCTSGGTHLTGLYIWGEPISQVCTSGGNPSHRFVHLGGTHLTGLYIWGNPSHRFVHRGKTHLKG